jgi:hypothetical protein
LNWPISLDLRAILPLFYRVHLVCRHGPKSLVSNREHHDQVSLGRGPSKQFPPFFACHSPCWDGYVRPRCNLLHLRRRYPVAQNVTHVCCIPLEALEIVDPILVYT